MNKKINILLFILFFMHPRLVCQENTNLSIIGSFHDNSLDTTQVETILLPSSISELSKSENKEVEEKPMSSLTVMNTSYVVGAINGSAEVSLTGAATYQIPIEIPKGVAGLEPAVSVNYNSQATNGLLGYGWSLTAYSVISRCGKSYYYDGSAGSVQFSNSDNLLLDGQRLFLVSGQNLTNGAIYRLEYDPFSEIKLTASGFQLKTGDGLIKDYGVTIDSNIEVSGSGTLFWLLSKVADINGNTINYTYDKITNKGEFYLMKIEYANNRKIEFAYETRSDKQKLYIAGAEVSNNKVLKSISTLINQIPVKKYEFNFVNDGFYSKLTEIIEYGQNNQRYNSTIIDYGYTEVQAKEYLSNLSEQRQGNKPLFADFNGDGIMDFLSYPEKTSYTTSDVATLFLGQNSLGNITFVKKGTIQIQSSSGIFQGFMLADLDGDGKMDLVNISKALNDTYRFNFYMFTGDNLVYDYKGFNTKGKEAIIGDFNGDGKNEILITENQKVFDGEGREIASGGITEWGDAYVKDYYPNDRYLCDFNGNGKTDILMINSSKAWVYELDGNTFVKLNTFNTTDIKNYYFPYFGDFNGDGNTDILIQNTTGGSYDDVSILFSTGKGFVKKAISNAEIRSKVQIGDFNKDGKSDIFHMEVIDNAIRMKVGTYNGTDFTTKYYSTYAPVASFNIDITYENYLFRVADFDGDGRADFCNARYVNLYYIHTFTDNQTLLVENIIDGLGLQTSFDYKPLTDVSVCSNSDNTATFPVVGRVFPLYVVRGMSQYASGFTNNTTYKYKNPNIHIQGKGFLCFNEIEAKNLTLNRTVTTKYGYNTYYYPFVTEQKITTQAELNISLSTFVNSYSYQSGKRITPYVKKQTETDYLTGVEKTTECTLINIYGSPLNVVTKYGSDVTETVAYSYNPNGITDNLWRARLPLTITKTTTRGSSNWTNKQSLAYDDKYRVNKTTVYTNDGTKKVLEESIVYDGFGNVEQIKEISFSSSDSLLTTFSYSPDGVFLRKKKNPMQLETSSSYNSVGLVESTTGHLNKTTSFIYDNMGRLTKTTYPDGTVSTTGYSWSSTPDNSVYFRMDSATGKPTVKTYYDAINRELRSSILKFNDVEMHIDKKYDSAGRLYQKSLPFTGSVASHWNTYSYDDYGRIAELLYASQKEDKYVYSGKQVTTTTNGIISQKTYNAKGELINVTDPAGIIVYTLRPDGQPSEISAPGNILTSIEYDEYGRKKKINDPSAGNKTFNYDAAGNVSEEIDSDNRKKLMAYDSYGRIISKQVSEFLTTYSYNDKGFLDTVLTNNGTQTTYTYDELGRLKAERDNAPDGKWLMKTYDYTSGKLSSILFSSQSGTIGTESYGYKNGYLNEIKFGSSVVWKLNAENVFGSPTSVTTGPVNRTYAYSTYGVPSARSASSNSAGTLQNFTFSINHATGNLSNRKDDSYNRNIQEDFTYDNLNRLLTYSGTTMEYSYKGNINIKPDVAIAFFYNTPDKPYAISEVNTGGNPAIALRNQVVEYTSFERPAKITENDYEASFIYDAWGQRKKMHLKKGTANEIQRYYLNDRYELDIKTSGEKQKLYIGGDAYTAPAVYVKTGSSWAMYYILRDYQGSITHLVNSSGNLHQEYSYDPWGRLRNPSNQQIYLPGNEPEIFLDRGYTGHEHLSIFGLINMNARLYDPAIGRFLSPDPYVQAPDFSQNFNRYSYCLNNPLKYTDPTGEIFVIDDILIAAAIGAFINLGIQGISGNINNVGDFFIAAGIGAAGGAAGGLAGQAVAGVLGTATSLGGALANGALVGASAGFAGGFVGGAGNAWMGGAGFRKGLQAGFLGGCYGALGGALVGSISGGIRYQREVSIFQKGCVELGVEGSDPVPATDKFLSEAQEVWYKDAPMDKVKIFTVENVPLKHLNGDDGLITHNAPAKTVAISIKGVLTGRSNVYFNKYLAFTNAKQLFYSMGHEFVHVSQISLLAGESGNLLSNSNFIDLMDFHAYSYQDKIGGLQLNGFTRDVVNGLATEFPNYFESLNYMKFPWTLSHSFKYPLK